MKKRLLPSTNGAHCSISHDRPQFSLKAVLLSTALSVVLIATKASGADIYISATGSFTYYSSQTYFGAGTSANPYYGDFDYIMSTRTAANDVIRLGTGTFATVGAWTSNNVKTGQVLSGNSGGSTIQLQGRHSWPGGNAIFSTANNVVVKDLTIDCDTNQVNNAGSYCVGGVVLQGDNCVVSNVTVIHATAWASIFETGAFWIGTPESTTNNLVIGCTADQCGGDLCNGINFKGGGMVASNNVVMGESGICLNSICKDATFRRNTCSGGGIGFYSDTGENRNVWVRDNSFTGQVDYGICMSLASSGQGISGVTITGNLVAPEPNPAGAALYIVNKAQSSSVTISNVCITNNAFAFLTAPTATCWAVVLSTPDYAVNTQGMFWNCYFGANKYYYSGSPVHNSFKMQDWTFEYNTDINGNPLSTSYFPADGTYYNSAFEW